MDRQAEAATGGVVVWVDFVSRVASYAPLERESRVDWMALAHDAEARAQTARTKRQRDLLIRCALEYRSKARIAGAGAKDVRRLTSDPIRAGPLKDHGV